MKIKAQHIILAISTILGLYLVLPLFKPGIPLNIDLPCHYLREWCVANSDWHVPNNWCAFMNAGIPTSQYYYPPVDFLILLLSRVVGLTLAYKCFLVLSLFSLGLGTFYLLHSRGHALAGSFAYAFLVLQPGSWHIGGFEETLMVGMWHYVLSIGFWIFFVGLFINFLEHPNFKRLFLCAFASAFLTHPMTLVGSFFTLTILALFMYKQILKNVRWLLMLAASALAINAYYLIPLVLKLSFFPSGGGGSISWELFNQFIYSKIPWYFVALSALGFVLLLKRKGPLAGICTGVALLTALNFSKPPLIKLLGVGVRLGPFIIIIVYLCAALALETLSKIRLKGLPKSSARYAVCLVALLLAVSLFTSTLSFRQSILLSEMDVFSPAIQAFSELKEGRVLVQDPLFTAGQHPLSFTHITCLAPVVSGLEHMGQALIFFPPELSPNPTEGGKMLGKKPADYTEAELRAILDKYNVKYIVAYSADYINTFAKLFPAAQVAPFVIFQTDVDPSFFKVENGEITNEVYEHTWASAQITAANKANIRFESNYYPNWKAYLNGKEIEIENCDGLMCVETTSGKLLIRYEILWYEYLGYLLTAAGLLVLILKIRNEATHKSY